MVLLFFSVIISVSASWIKDYESGDWSICTLTSWEDISGQGRNGKAQWHQTVQNFSGIRLRINFTELYTFRSLWWHESASKSFDLWLNITDEDAENNIYACFDFWDWQRMWGGQWGRNIGSGFEVNWSKGYEGIGFMSKRYDLFPSYVDVMIWINRTDNRMYAYSYLYDPDLPKPVLLDYIYSWDEKGDGVPIGSNAFENVTVTFYMTHNGNGRFKGGMSLELHADEVYSPEQPETLKGVERDIWGFIDGLKRLIEGVLPDWLSDWLVSLGAWFQWFFATLGNVWAIVISFMPFFPLIVIFYVMDAGMTSIMTGSFEPIGLCVMTIYNTLRGVIEAIVVIIQTIYDFIHFW